MNGPLIALAGVAVLAMSACDRVANISGTYGAFLKSWQSNAPKVSSSCNRGLF